MLTHLETELLQALERFESHLDTPIVPGELPDWLRSIQRGCQRARIALIREFDEVHPELFNEIEEQDPGLIQRVEQMQDTDGDLWKRCLEIESLWQTMGPRAEQAEPHESQLHPRIDELTGRSLKWIVDVRRQEQTVKTWYVEAFQRDRGVVD